MSAHFVVGIDLGTTHCAMASASLDDEKARPAILPIPQLVAPGTIEAKALLPSFVYFAHESDGAQALPWDKTRTFAVGEHARARGADAPARVIASAKSWLVHPSVDRRSGILPQGAPDDVEKISPVEASWRLLEHMSEAWDAEHAGAPLAEQEVILTVPASFDAGARELTVEAALAAGIEKLTLLEEPQAALYAWIDAMGDAWRKALRPGDVVLVIDIGGGTSDFSEIAAVEREGSLELVRVAVGDHILLGGDNMDLALAHVARTKLEAQGKEIDRWQMAALVHACRAAKERLLSDAKGDTAPIALGARGSKLVGGALRTELTCAEVTQTIVDGFFPEVASSVRPIARARAALTQLGLPYASDAAITKHLAAFLGRQASAHAALEGFTSAQHGDARDRTPTLLHPTAILFNGGVLKADAIRARIVATIDAWLAADGAPRASSMRSTWISASRAARRRTASRVVVAGCAFAAARRARTTSASRARFRRSRASNRRSRRCASHRSGWKKEPTRRSRRTSSARWSASRSASASSDRPRVAETPQARCSNVGRTESSKSSRRSKSRCPRRGDAKAMSCRCDCTRR